MWMVKGSPAEESYWGAVTRIASEKTGRYARKLLSLPRDSFHARIAIADGFDRILEDDQKLVDSVLQKNIDHAVKLGGQGGIWNTLEEWAIYADTFAALFVWKGLTTIAQGFVDVLRLGQGTLHEKSATGVGKDVLRLLSILPLGEVAQVLKVARIKPLAALPAQDLMLTAECTSNSAVRAMWMTRFKFFARVTDLWAEYGMMPPRNPMTQGLHIHEAVPALEGLGARVSQTAIREGSSLAEISRIARANPHDVVMFSIEATAQGGRPIRHTLLASALEGSVKFYDTTGKVFRNIEALDNFYAMASPYEAIIVHEARAMTAARTAMGAFHPLVIFDQVALPMVNRPAAPLVADRMRGIMDAKKKSQGSGNGQTPPPRDPKTLELERLTQDELEFENDHWVTKPRDRFVYRVRPGDSLQLIAQHFYGSAKMASEIYRMNQGTVGPPPNYMIHPGQRLNMPDL